MAVTPTPLLQDDHDTWEDTSDTNSIAGVGGICLNESAEGREEKDEGYDCQDCMDNRGMLQPTKKEHKQGWWGSPNRQSAKNQKQRDTYQYQA